MPADLQTTVYEALLTIQSTSVEAEMGFHACGLWTKCGLVHTTPQSMLCSVDVERLCCPAVA